MRRYANHVDANQKEICDALRAVGADPEIIGRPCDLLVGYRGRNYLLEVKNPATAYGRGKQDNSHKTQAKQMAWRAAWRGQSAVVSSVDEALRVIGAIRPEEAVRAISEVGT